MSTSFIRPQDHKQLFLDDGAIERMSGVKRTLHQPEKCGAVLRPDRSRGQIALQSRSVPQWNPEKAHWEWWYWGSYSVPPYGPYHSTAISLVHYATSADGIHWETPSLGLYEWRGSKDNNIACDPEAGHRSLYHIIRDEQDEDPQRRYKGLFNSSNRTPAISPDGFDWTELDVPEIPSSDESHFTWDEQSEQYLAMVKKGTEWGRSVWLSTSKDFIHWTEPKLTLRSDEVDKENRKCRIQQVVEGPAYLSPPLVDDGDYIGEVYQMAVMPYEGIYVGFPGLFNPAGAIPPPQTNHTGINQVELTVSRDLYHWERVADREVFIGVDPWDGVNYGTAQNLLCGRPHVHKDREIRIYYNACRFRGHRELYQDVDEKLFSDMSALALAKLRLDGFVSLDGEEEGEVITRPFEVGGEGLTVNVDASQGQLRAELLDAETMAPLPGFSADESEALPGDHLAGRLAWRGGQALAAERPVRVRFRLQRAQLYAFWLEA